MFLTTSNIIEIYSERSGRTIANSFKIDNYCDEWTTLCEFTASMPPPNQGYAAARDTLMLGMNVYNEARDMRCRHERLHKELRKNRHGLTSVLSSENSRARGGRRLQIQATYPPNGMDSLTEAYAALSNVGTAKGNTVAFFKDHVDHLNKMLSGLPMTIHELRASAEKWSNSKLVLLAPMSSISKSSHIVTVDPASVPPPPPVTYPPLLDSTIPHVTAFPRDAYLYQESIDRRGRPVWSKPGLIVAVLTLLLTFIGVVGTMSALWTTKRGV